MKRNENNSQPEIGELISEAGHRPAIPPEDFTAIKEAAGSAWRQMVAAERRRKSRRRTVYALAASLVAVLLGGWWLLSGLSPFGAAPVATVQFSTGNIGVAADLETGAILEPTGLVALRMAQGQSVRINEGTRLQLLSESRLQLERGAVYVDSGPSVSIDAALEILTPFGLVREIGTQFEVRLTDEAENMQISVREGGVSIQTNGATHSAARGEQLTLLRDGSAARTEVAPDGEQWLWVMEAAPAIEIDGRSLASYLDWVARETGWRIRYADEELERSAGTILLHGTIEGLRPDESLSIILEGSGLYYLTEDGAILIVRP